MGARPADDAPRADPHRDRARDAGRVGIPQATLTDWEPPADDDDDHPILAGGARRPAAPTARRQTPLDEAETVIGLPSERSAVTARPRDAVDDDAIDTDRHPRLPNLPGISEGMPGFTVGTPAAALPRREGRGPGRGPTRERERPRGERSAEVRPAGDRPVGDRPDADRPPREPRAPREPREPREPDARDDASLANIFLNVGRRDGVNPEDLQKLLADAGGIPASETSNIRVRDRITFVTVKKELADQAIKTLAGQVMGGRTVVAEPARDKA